MNNITARIFADKDVFFLPDLTLVREGADILYFQCPWCKPPQAEPHYASMTRIGFNELEIPVLTCYFSNKQAFCIREGGATDEKEEFRYWKGLVKWYDAVPEGLSPKESFKLYNNGCPYDLLDDSDELRAMVKAHRHKGKQTSKQGKRAVYETNSNPG